MTTHQSSARRRAGTRHRAFGFAAACLLAAGATAQTSHGPERLKAKYRELESSLADNDFAAPVCVESVDRDNYMRGDVYGIVDFEFGLPARVLCRAEDWCEIAALHPNIKAAISSRDAAGQRVTLFYGRKFFQKPKASRAISLAFACEERRDDYVRVTMSGDEGPHGTRDHRISCEAVPLGGDRTFVHLSYSCTSGGTARTGIALYLATLGRNRVGFTVVDRERDGEPVYIGGMRGIVERNAMRYYLAVKCYLTTLDLPEGERFERCAQMWYDESMVYAEQLNDYEPGEYVRYKRLEREECLRLKQTAAQE